MRFLLLTILLLQLALVSADYYGRPGQYKPPKEKKRRPYVPRRRPGKWYNIMHEQPFHGYARYYDDEIVYQQSECDYGFVDCTNTNPKRFNLGNLVNREIKYGRRNRDYYY